MKIFVNQITSVIMGINISQMPASYVINAKDDFNFNKDINNISYVREYVTQAMISNGTFSPSEINQPLYFDSNGNLTTSAGNGNTPALTAVASPQSYDFVSYPTKFSLKDVIIGKANYILSADMFKYITLDELLDFSYIDLSKNSLVNLGVKSIEMLPSGVCTTLPITLPEASSIFSLYLESSSSANIKCEIGYKDASGDMNFETFTMTQDPTMSIMSTSATSPLILNTAITEAYVRFTNLDSINSQTVSAYGLLY